MAVLTNTMMQGTAADTGDDDYQLKHSIRLDAGSEAYLTRKVGTLHDSQYGDGRKWTFAAWIKNTDAQAASRTIFSMAKGNGLGDAGTIQLRLLSTGFYFDYTDSGGNGQWSAEGKRQYRDPSAWFHLTVRFDSSEGANTDRIKLYVNGELQTDWGTQNTIVQHTKLGLQTNSRITLGGYGASNVTVTSPYGNCLFSDVYLIDGLALTPAAFGSFDSTGVWNPKAFALPAPNNGTDWSDDDNWSGDEIWGGAGPAPNAFDGDLSTKMLSSNTNATIHWTPPEAITYKQSVRIYIDTTGFFKINDTAEIVQTTGSGSLQWETIYGSGTIEKLTFQSIGGDTVQLAAVEVDGVILIDNQTDSDTRNNPNHGQVYGNISHLLAGSSGGPTNPGNCFDGNTTTYGVEATGHGSWFQLTPTSPITFNDKVEIWIQGHNDTNAEVAYTFNPSSVSYSSATPSWATANKNKWTTVASGGGTFTKVAGKNSDSSTQGIRLYAVRVDGHILIDGATDQSFNLKFDEVDNITQIGHDAFVDSTEDTNPVYSVCVDNDAHSRNYPSSRGFDGLLTKFTLGPGSGGIYKFDFTSLGGISYTNGVQCYLNNTTNGQFDRTRVNGGSWTTWNTGGTGDQNEWVNVATGSGTLNTFEVEDDPTNSVSGVAEGMFYALRINGDTILKDRGGNNFFPKNLTTIDSVGTKITQTTGTQGDWTGSSWSSTPPGQGTNAKLIYTGRDDSVFEFDPPIVGNGEITVRQYTDGGATGADKFRIYDGSSWGDWKDFHGGSNYAWQNRASGKNTLEKIEIDHGGGGTDPHIAGFYLNGGTADSDWWPYVQSTTGHNDVSVDTPTNYKGDGSDATGGVTRGNYCTWNPLHNTNTLSQGNLTTTTTSGGNECSAGTISITTGKWYYELHVHTKHGSGYPMIGIAETNKAVGTNLGQTNAFSYYSATGTTKSGTSYTAASAGDIIGVAVDADNGRIYYALNNTWQNSGDPTNSAATGAEQTWTAGEKTFVPWVSEHDGSQGHTNFGQRAFKYTAPSGYKCLCTQNLDNTFSGAQLNNPSKYFDTKLWTGVSGDLDVKSYDFRPDLVWIKRRSATNYHQLYDAIRGADDVLFPNADSAAQSESNTALKAFLDNGFTLGDHTGVNDDADTYVGYGWDAGTAAATASTEGSITPSGQWKNATAGFSITTYTGTGSAATVGHGLSVKPDMYIIKNRSTGSTHWLVYTDKIDGSLDYFFLDDTDAKADSSNSLPTNTVFSVGSGASNGASGDDYVCYSWAGVPGYSAFGSYTGNANADGPFVYTGFRVKYLLQKRSDAASNWQLMDSARDDDHDGPGNPIKRRLKAEGNDAEFDGVSTNTQFDFLSNGFKIRDTDSGINANSGTYIYAAFAEHPFKTARAH